MPTRYRVNTLDTTKLRFPASTAFTCMDALWYDSATGYAKRASAFTDQGSAALNQQAFAKVFCGFAGADRQATETNIVEGIVVTECDADVTVASATYNHGDMLAIARDAGNSVNYNQTFVRTTDPSAAIGTVQGYYGTATTTVVARFKVRNLPTVVAAPARISRVVAKTADYTLVAADSGTLFTNQGAAGAVNFTLPALASIDASFRVEFFCEAGQTITVTAPSGKLVAFNNATATSIAYATSSEKIGGGFEIVPNADVSKYLAKVNLGTETQTPTIA